MTKLILTALVSLAVGAGGTYAMVQVTATCQAPAIADDGGTKKFMAAPLFPLTGPAYK